MDLVFLTFVGVILGLARCHICPTHKAYTIHNATRYSNGKVTVQQGALQRIPCVAFRPGERIRIAVWYREGSPNGPPRQRLISSDEERNTHYAMSLDNSLVIQNVTLKDEGRYKCSVVPLAVTNRDSFIYLDVIGDAFPAVTPDITKSASIKRDLRNTIPCPCGRQAGTLYWSIGTGVSTDTAILSSRFPDGTVLQFRYGLDFSIGRDSSLIVNSIADIDSHARFWCHVFKLDGSLRNCYVDVEILTDEYPSDHALRSSASSFYILKGTNQRLPCIKRTMTEQTCEMQWYEDDVLILIYTAWSDVTYTHPAFNLSSDFGLVLKSVNDDDAGRYMCSLSSGYEAIDVRVIGDTFHLDNGLIARAETITFKAGLNYTLKCPAGLNNTDLRVMVFWSFGQNDANETTIIGTLKLPGGSKEIADLEDSRCFDISNDGELRGCSQDSDIRYWCHVFTEDGMLYRSYVDMIVQNHSAPIYVVIIVVLAIVFALIACGVIIVCRIRRKTTSHYEMTSNLEDNTITKLINEVKMFVLSRMGRMPITPWVTDDNACYAPIECVYTQLELFINVYTTERTMRYRLDSESDIFDDGILQFKNRHVLIEGRAGSGKTSFLHKLAFDRYKDQPTGLLGRTKLVFVLPASLLIQFENIGEAVVQHLLKADTDISKKYINSYCKNHSSDVAILVDDCDEKNDIHLVMKVIKDQGLMNAQIVMATRQTEQVENASRELDLRHITVTGFTEDNALRYVGSFLKNIEMATGYCGNIHKSLNEHIVHPDVYCLPINLTALCQLCKWTQGEIFTQGVTMCDLFSKLVKYMFQFHRATCKAKERTQASDALSEVSIKGDFTSDQQNLLIRLGRIALTQVRDIPCNTVVFTEEDFKPKSGPNEQNVFDDAIQIGLLREHKVHGRSGSKTQRTAYFVLRIFQDLCVGMSLSQTQESLSHWLTKMLPFSTKFANVFVFAGLSSQVAHTLAIKQAITLAQSEKVTTQTKYEKKVQIRIRKLQRQKMVEMCLLLNIEAKGGNTLVQQISPMFDEGKVFMFGVSSHKLRLLTYLLKHLPQDSSRSVNLKSIQLFRIGNHPSAELRDYLDYFLPGVLDDTDSETSRLQESDSENMTMRELLERVESRLSGLPGPSPSGQSDTSVLLTLHYPGLLDILQSQSGQCYSASSSRAFARCLPDLKTLKKIVLIGTILSSNDLCYLAKELDKLPNLKMLDLRLNKQTDDKVFVAITNSLNAYKSLIDLRLSLYMVTIDGFDHAKQALEKSDKSWSRLSTLYLLHGNPAAAFIGFLTPIMKYLQGVKKLHISSVDPMDKLQCQSIDAFQNEISSRMRNLKKLDINNMDDLKERCELQKSSIFNEIKEAVKPSKKTKGIADVNKGGEPSDLSESQDVVRKEDNLKDQDLVMQDIDDIVHVNVVGSQNTSDTTTTAL